MKNVGWKNVNKNIKWLLSDVFAVLVIHRLNSVSTRVHSLLPWLGEH